MPASAMSHAEAVLAARAGRSAETLAMLEPPVAAALFGEACCWRDLPAFTFWSNIEVHR